MMNDQGHRKEAGFIRTDGQLTIFEFSIICSIRCKHIRQRLPIAVATSQASLVAARWPVAIPLRQKWVSKSTAEKFTLLIYNL